MTALEAKIKVLFNRMNDSNKKHYTELKGRIENEALTDHFETGCFVLPDSVKTILELEGFKTIKAHDDFKIIWE